jgi:hypothetical protein
MEILVMLEGSTERLRGLAEAGRAPDALDAGQSSRDIVTLYGNPSAESIALALAAAVEGHRSGQGTADGGPEVIRHLGVWPERGAVGDAAWRDGSGQLVTQDLEIPLDILRATATRLMSECGEVIGRLVAGFSVPDWPDGARRAIRVSLGPIGGLTAPVFRPLESFLEAWREADGLAFDYEGE